MSVRNQVRVSNLKRCVLTTQDSIDVYHYDNQREQQQLSGNRESPRRGSLLRSQLVFAHPRTIPIKLIDHSSSDEVWVDEYHTRESFDDLKKTLHKAEQVDDNEHFRDENNNIISNEPPVAAQQQVKGVLLETWLNDSSNFVGSSLSAEDLQRVETNNATNVNKDESMETSHHSQIENREESANYEQGMDDEDYEIKVGSGFTLFVFLFLCFTKATY